MLNIVYLAHKNIRLKFGPKTGLKSYIKLHYNQCFEEHTSNGTFWTDPRVCKSYLIQVNNISIVEIGENAEYFI